MIIDIDIEQMPDWARAAEEFGDTVTGAVLRAAVLMIVDNTGRMRSRVTLTGGQQRANSESWADHKRRTRGHDIPLVYGAPNPILSDPRRWLINDRPAADMIARSVVDLQSYGRRYGQTRKGYRLRSTGVEFVVVKLPPEREQIAIALEVEGYDVPFGIPPEMASILRNEVEVALNKFRFKATFAGTSSGPFPFQRGT